MFKFQVKWPGQVPKIQSNPTQSNPIQSNPIQSNVEVSSQLTKPSEAKLSKYWGHLKDNWGGNPCGGRSWSGGGFNSAVRMEQWRRGFPRAWGRPIGKWKTNPVANPLLFLILWFDWCSFRRLIYSLWNSFGPWLQFNSTGSNPSFNHSSHRRREILLRPRLQFPPPFF